ncbi:hypothetical protein [Exiguobacterium qingdaonense]|uniref:hypothetical protein n=1 Tax=Exiguobacterium qingdaonense TaxID=2751251 RepID=UPI001BE6F6AB|nr:hypothetical protein [Exiguobacterium qingdaonense]
MIVVDVEKWLFVQKKEADEATVPTILVEKDIQGATWFTSMKILFQLKKWTGRRQFVPLLAYDEETYRSYEVFHVDAVPSMTLLDGGKTLLVDNRRDEAYDVALQASGLGKEESILLFALQYIEQMTNEPVVFAGDESVDAKRIVPTALLDKTDRLESGRRLFEWMREEDVREENRHD